MTLTDQIRRRRTLLVALPIAAALALVAGPFVYLNYIKEDAPERLSLTEAPPVSTSVDEATALDGTWTVAEGQAGYRVREVLFGQSAVAAGRTSAVTGTLAVDGATVTSGTFTVDLTTVRSDEERRDRQFHGRIMDTASHPTATFELTDPLDLGAVPADGQERTLTASGTFTIRGASRPVTIDVTARRSGPTVQASGSVPVTFADYGIPDPSFGPAQVEDHGEIEFLLTFSRT